MINISEAIKRHAGYYLKLEEQGANSTADQLQIARAKRQLKTGRVERLLPPVSQRSN